MPRLMAEAKTATTPGRGETAGRRPEPLLRKVLMFLCVVVLNASIFIPIWREGGMLTTGLRTIARYFDFAG